MFKKALRHVFIALIYSVIVIMVVYLTLRLFQMVLASYYWYDKLLGTLLLVAEFYIILTQGVGYLSELLRVFLKFKDSKDDRPEVPELKTSPLVSILIPSYNEPIAILEDTIVGSYNLTYGNKHIFLLDDTRYDTLSKNEGNQYKQDIETLCEKFNINLFRRKWRGAKAGIINDYLAFSSGERNEDFKFVSYEKSEEEKEKAMQKAKYFVLFDADQNPYPEFVEPLVALSEDDDGIALIQTPQYYTNFEGNRIAKAAALQQVIFYEYLCVGKGIEEVVFCCGSNVLIRTEAIVGVGGFDETTVTEDFATSLKLHMAGWRTKYYNKVGVFGLAPVDLGNYFKQQFRWAMGAMDLFKKLVVNIIKNPRKLSFIKWWEYIISTTFYFSSLMYVILWGCPIIFLLFGIPSFFASPIIYAVVFLPYFVLSIAMFFWSLRKRNYKSLDILRGQILLWVSFPVFIKASFYGLLGIRKKFEVTSKEGSEIYPLIKLWPQIIFGFLCFVAVVWGLNRLYYERTYLALIPNIIWTFYNFIVMSSIFYFNVPKKTEKILALDG